MKEIIGSPSWQATHRGSKRMANPNFTVKLQLDEAGDVRDGLELLYYTLLQTPVTTMTDPQKHQVGRIETLLRREFGTIRPRATEA